MATAGAAGLVCSTRASEKRHSGRETRRRRVSRPQDRFSAPGEVNGRELHPTGPVGSAGSRMGDMGSRGAPEWLIREDAAQPVLIALYLRQALGIRSPDELPYLRGIAPRANDRSEESQAQLERQWREYWAMTVEPQAHPSPVPLDLVDGFETLLALPTEGADALRASRRSARDRGARVRAVRARPLSPGCRQRHRLPRLRERDRRARAPGRPPRALVRAQRAGAAAESAGRLVDRLADGGGHRRTARGCRGLRRRDPPDHRRAGLIALLSPRGSRSDPPSPRGCGAMTGGRGSAPRRRRAPGRPGCTPGT